MNSYFIRHTDRMTIEESYLERLWNEDTICIHYPDREERVTDVDNDSREPEDYKKGKPRSTMNIFRKIADEGGYVWTESRVSGKAKVGIVKPQKIDLSSAKWTYSEKYPSREGTEAILKTLKLSNPREVERHDLVGLKASRPRQGTLCNWKAAGERLADTIECRETRKVWSNLSTAQQEASCAEYLRLHEGNHPRLAFLLLPVGRTLKDIDIYGVDSEGRKLFAQVTFYTKQKSAFKDKLKKLKAYGEDGAKLVYLCHGVEYGVEDGVFYVPVSGGLNSVEGWLNSEAGYGDALFSS